MSSETMKETLHNAEHARHNPNATPVALTMAILAAVVAIVSLLGHRSHTEEVIIQNQISDTWAHYQAKNIRRNTDQMFTDLASFVTSKDDRAVSKVLGRYQGEVRRYGKEEEDLMSEARKLEHELASQHKQTNFYDLGEVFIEIALVVTSITLLSDRRSFWHTGIVLGATGSILVICGLLIFIR